MRQGLVGQAVAFAVEREGLEGLELAEVPELGVAEFGAVFEHDPGHGAGGLGDLRAEGAELGGGRGVAGGGDRGVCEREEGEEAGGEARGQEGVGEWDGFHTFAIRGCESAVGNRGGSSEGAIDFRFEIGDFRNVI